MQPVLLAGVEGGDDIRMLKLRGRLDLPMEAPDASGARGSRVISRM